MPECLVCNSPCDSPCNPRTDAGWTVTTPDDRRNSNCPSGRGGNASQQVAVSCASYSRSPRTLLLLRFENLYPERSICPDDRIAAGQHCNIPGAGSEECRQRLMFSRPREVATVRRHGVLPTLICIRLLTACRQAERISGIFCVKKSDVKHSERQQQEFEWSDWMCADNKAMGTITDPERKHRPEEFRKSLRPGLKRVHAEMAAIGERTVQNGRQFASSVRLLRSHCSWCWFCHGTLRW